MFVMASPLAISSLIEKSLVYLDGVMVSAMLTTTAYAFYRAGAVEVPFVAGLYGSVTAIVMPEIAKLFSDNNLKEIIKNYIYRYSLNDGDKLFRKFSSSATFNVAIKRIFSKIYSKKITLSNIRYSYIIWDLRTTRSINYLSNLAAMMGHSAEEQQLYKIS